MLPVRNPWPAVLIARRRTTSSCGGVPAGRRKPAAHCMSSDAAPGVRPRWRSSPRGPPFMPSLVAGGVLGVLSGVTGVGGGIFLTPLVLALGWAGARQVAAISAVFNLLKSGPPWRAHGHHARPAFGASTLAAMCGCRRVYRLVVGNELFEARNVAQDFSLPPDSRGTADDRKRCRVTERVSGGEPDCSIVVGWSSLFSRMLTATSARAPDFASSMAASRSASSEPPGSSTRPSLWRRWK
ncbi:UNVERIFIED_ORG: hypothetical protein QE434_002094 [Rhizobium sp. SORGH_AS 755]|nr:hypothetical protein [Rhizobium sp. SORGH_AS_0755]